MTSNPGSPNTRSPSERFPAATNEPVTEITVISDTHFGDGEDIMSRAEEVDGLVETMAERGAGQRLVLLGDILDLWKSTLHDCIRAGEYFFRRISLLEGMREIVLVPGNHDHEILMYHYRRQVADALREGDLSPPPFEPVKRYADPFLKGLLHPDSEASMRVEYPYHLFDSGGKKVVLAHGHHLDFFASSFGCLKTFWLSRRILGRRMKKPTLKEIELTNLPFYGTLSLTPLVPEIVASEYRFYGAIRFLSRLARRPSMRESRLRDALIKDQYDEIGQLLTLFEHPEPDCFIFGHTHRAGMGRLPDRRTVVVNSGSWLERKSERVPTRTWVEIKRDVKLMSIGDGGSRILYSEAL